MRRSAAITMATGWFVLVLAGVAAAAPQDVANSLSMQIMSPFCPGVTLHDCPSENAVTLRARIAHWAALGWSRQKIMDKLITEYGPDIRAVPPARGGALLAWILPAFAVLSGGTAAWLLARRWARRKPDVEPARPSISSEARSRLDAELAELRGEM